MAGPVKLSDVVAQMDVPNDEWTVYLNKRTGDIVIVAPEDEELAEDEFELDENAADWEVQQRQQIRKAVASDDYMALPDKFEIHECSIMERFARTRDDPTERNLLDRAVHGRGAFSQFKRVLDDFGVREDWHSFRQSAFEDIAVSWLEENEIAYDSDGSAN